MVWLNGFPYRKPITITNPVNAAGYQHYISVTYDADMQAAFGDLRFTDELGNNCPYWVESYTVSSSAVVWVKVPLANTDTLYMYYGNNNALSESNGDKTFEFFDDFLGSAVDATKWTSSGSGITVTGGFLSITQSNSEHRLVYTPTTPFIPNTICRIKGSQDAVYASVQDSYGFLSFIREPGGQLQTFSYVTGEQRTNIGTGYTGTHYFEQVRNGTTSVIFKIDGTTVATHTTQVPTSNLNLRCIAYQSAYGQVLYVHHLLVRKYTATEPSCSIGSNLRRAAAAWKKGA